MSGTYAMAAHCSVAYILSIGGTWSASSWIQAMIYMYSKRLFEGGQKLIEEYAGDSTASSWIRTMIYRLSSMRLFEVGQKLLLEEDGFELWSTDYLAWGYLK